MNSFLKQILFVACFCIIGCKAFKEKYVVNVGMTGEKRIIFHKQNDQKRSKKIYECVNSWEYADLTESLKLDVLNYIKSSSFDMFQYPAVIIGTTVKMDTIRILCYNFKEDLKKGQTINVFQDSFNIVSDNGSNNQSIYMSIKPDIYIPLSKNKEDDYIHCLVKRTYFGKVVL